ncbi:hypothetical protein EAI91_07170 [Lacticaseibacillus paracasei]|uniref:Alpha-galactosidase n=1 Tax=Lacticaseibacillus paracasei TaxID=1597 RepID=A0AB36XE90_LACPA|nr:Alpha-galactosidase [Lacticaseibacillus paracasei]AZP98108.1 hypothetical protein CYL78_04265 [Lacticaseibacillus paracasei subsp. tolerans]EPC12022.1 hypothetical protein Lpp230_2145 [Lacticaseibacillus paracasei subsp. paracasei Lpp230]MBG1273516.1 hypothetical protein [Lacticaseibacillus paracasei subsp. paracasei]NIG84948.1 hypothetical protein [Lactobacillus sp. L.sR5]PTS46890.1 hypothetical protein DBQ69_03160 [Lactobacillus sp. DS1_6]PTS51138.1 hypothetical protein DBQ62_05515 [Lact
MQTRSLAQKPTCKDLGRSGQNTTITTKAAYTPVSTRADSRSYKNSQPLDFSSMWLAIVFSRKKKRPHG